jgi:cyclic pyranopterin phosphate synthase
MKNHLIDSFQRPLKDLRISVIDQCNFRCSYCMPAEIFGPDYQFLKKNELLSFSEILRLSRIFASLGVTKLRLTGGEPLLRKDLHELIKDLKEIDGIKDIALTTNGVYLPKYAKQLKDAGLDRVNISLDAINDDIFSKMNGRKVGTRSVLSGIEAATNASLLVKVNMVVRKGVNDSEILPMAKYFKDKGITLRFIEFMDVGNTNGWNLAEVVSKKEILDTIDKEMPMEPVEAEYFGEVANRYRYKDSTTEVGIISSVTDSFCSSCTRARLSADGKLYTCLFASKGHDLRTLVRSEEINDKELEDEIVTIWSRRDDRYSDERLMNTEQSKNRPKIEMSYIGG